MTKLCPLLSYRKQYLNEMDCYEDKCAWYVSNIQKCGLIFTEKIKIPFSEFYANDNRDDDYLPYLSKRKGE